MSQERGPDAGGLAALRERFEQQSRKARAYYSVMHAAQAKLGSIDAASAWMEAPQATLDGATPAQWVAAGRVDEVLARVAALER